MRHKEARVDESLKWKWCIDNMYVAEAAKLLFRPLAEHVDERDCRWEMIGDFRMPAVVDLDAEQFIRAPQCNNIIRNAGLPRDVATQ